MENIILFDLDGTLIDSTEAIVSTMKHAFKVMNDEFKGEDKDITDLIGHPLDIMFLDLGVDESLVWDYVKAYKDRYQLISKEQTTLLNYAVESLEYASSFARLSIVTTKTGKFTIPLLEHLGILKFFEIITGREDVENPKPHPEPIEITLNKMNVTKTSNIWMIGDTPLDLIAAQGASINSCAVLCGYGEEESLKQYTSYITPNPLEAVKLIKNLSEL